MATSTPEEPLPAFCGPCGQSNGFGRSPVTGFWVCDACGKPRELWWRSQQKKIARLSRKGLCTKDAGVVSWKRRRCSGHDQ